MLFLNFYSKIHAKLRVKCNASNCHASTSFGIVQNKYLGLGTQKTRTLKDQNPKNPDPKNWDS